jgi:hypothetical protein
MVASEMWYNALYATYDAVSTWVLVHLEDYSHLKAGYKSDKTKHTSHSEGAYHTDLG